MATEQEGAAGPVGFDTGSRVPGFGLPAIWTNYFFARVTNETTRIAFGDQVPQAGTNYHTSLIMTTENALLLAQLILDLHSKNKTQAPSPTPQGT